VKKHYAFHPITRRQGTAVRPARTEEAETQLPGLFFLPMVQRPALRVLFKPKKVP
jgi:hypothetical protein